MEISVLKRTHVQLGFKEFLTSKLLQLLPRNISERILWSLWPCSLTCATGSHRSRLQSRQTTSACLILWWVLVSPCEGAYLPLITGTVHDGVDTPVKESIFLLESWDENWTGGVMDSATLVCLPEATKMCILAGSLPLPAPFCARHSE